MKYKKPDANQLQIEQYLQQLGFWTYRTANDAPQHNSYEREFHPLDLLVLGANRRTNQTELSLWEIKVGSDSSFTDQELIFLESVKRFFDDEVPVRIATSVDDILAWYGWIDTQE